DVEAAGVDAAAGVLDDRGERGEAVLAASADDDVVSLAGEPQRGCVSDAAARTGDQDDLRGLVAAHLLPFGRDRGSSGVSRLCVVGVVGAAGQISPRVERGAEGVESGGGDVVGGLAEQQPQGWVV